MQRWLVWLSVGVLLCLPLSTHAELAFCGDATGVVWYNPSIDPSRVPNTVQGKACTVIAKASGNTESQKAVVDTVRTQYPSVIHDPNPLRYIKVVSSLMVEMTQGEKDAVNATVDAAAAEAQTFIDEVTTQDICSTATLAQINTKIATIHDTLETTINSGRDTLQTTIDGVTNLTNAKTAMTAMNNATAAMGREINDTYAVALRKLARCLIALRHVR